MVDYKLKIEVDAAELEKILTKTFAKAGNQFGDMGSIFKGTPFDDKKIKEIDRLMRSSTKNIIQHHKVDADGQIRVIKAKKDMILEIKREQDAINSYGRIQDRLRQKEMKNLSLRNAMARAGGVRGGAGKNLGSLFGTLLGGSTGGAIGGGIGTMADMFANKKGFYQPKKPKQTKGFAGLADAVHGKDSKKGMFMKQLDLENNTKERKLPQSVKLVGILAGLAGAAGLGKLIIDSSPILQSMFKLLNVGIMLILRPIGDFIGFMLRPLLIEFVKKVAIPAYKKGATLAKEWGTKVGGTILQFFVDPFGTAKTILLDALKSFAGWMAGNPNASAESCLQNTMNDFLDDPYGDGTHGQEKKECVGPPQVLDFCNLVFQPFLIFLGKLNAFVATTGPIVDSLTDAWVKSIGKLSTFLTNVKGSIDDMVRGFLLAIGKINQLFGQTIPNQAKAASTGAKTFGTSMKGLFIRLNQSFLMGLGKLNLFFLKTIPEKIATAMKSIADDFAMAFKKLLYGENPIFDEKSIPDKGPTGKPTPGKQTSVFNKGNKGPSYGEAFDDFAKVVEKSASGISKWTDAFKGAFNKAVIKAKIKSTAKATLPQIIGELIGFLVLDPLLRSMSPEWGAFRTGVEAEGDKNWIAIKNFWKSLTGQNVDDIPTPEEIWDLDKNPTAGDQGIKYSEGTIKVPKDQIAKVHEGEMIIPAKEAEALRTDKGNMINNAFKEYRAKFGTNKGAREGGVVSHNAGGQDGYDNPDFAWDGSKWRDEVEEEEKKPMTARENMAKYGNVNGKQISENLEDATDETEEQLTYAQQQTKLEEEKTRLIEQQKARVQEMLDKFSNLNPLLGGQCFGGNGDGTGSSFDNAFQAANPSFGKFKASNGKWYDTKEEAQDNSRDSSGNVDTSYVPEVGGYTGGGQVTGALHSGADSYTSNNAKDLANFNSQTKSYIDSSTTGEVMEGRVGEVKDKYKEVLKQVNAGAGQYHGGSSGARTQWANLQSKLKAYQGMMDYGIGKYETQKGAGYEGEFDKAKEANKVLETTYKDYRGNDVPWRGTWAQGKDQIRELNASIQSNNNKSSTPGHFDASGDRGRQTGEMRRKVEAINAILQENKPDYSFANGGILNERVLGMGSSGKTYEFGEKGPEMFTPSRATCHRYKGYDKNVSGSTRPEGDIKFNITINGVRDLTDIERKLRPIILKVIKESRARVGIV